MFPGPQPRSSRRPFPSRLKRSVIRVKTASGQGGR